MIINKRIILSLVALTGLSVSAPSFAMDIPAEISQELFEAIEKNNVAKVKELVEIFKVDINLITNIFGETPLYRACRSNRIRLVELLLKYCTKETVNKG
jgi:hypothetical protein